MNYMQRERVAFWMDQILVGAVTIASIWFASRIGFEEAVRYTRHHEKLATYELVRAVYNELVSNEYALTAAVQDWGSPEMKGVQLSTHAYEAVLKSEKIFLLDPETTTALGGVYTDSLDRTILGIHEQGGGHALSEYVLNLWLHLARLNATKPLLRKELDRIAGMIRDKRPEDILPLEEERRPVERDPTPFEIKAMALAAAPSWRREDASEYTGPLRDLTFAYFANPALPMGPLLLEFYGDLPSGRKPVRFWICFLEQPPFEHGLQVGTDDKHLRSYFSCRLPKGGWAWSIPFTKHRGAAFQGQVVDGSRPIAWTWAYAFIEDDKGERHPILNFKSFKIGARSNRRKHFLKVSDDALVLPKREAN